MNARQRRKARRARGIRLPARCVWCDGKITRWDGPCECFERFGVQPRYPRRIFEDLTVREFTREGLRRGINVRLALDLPAPSLLTSVAVFAEGLESAVITALKDSKE
jgi:hypothetical protein